MKNKTHAASPAAIAALLAAALLSAGQTAHAVPPVPGGKPLDATPGSPSSVPNKGSVVTPPGHNSAAGNGAVDDVRQLIASAPRGTDFPNAAKATLLDLSDITVRPDGSTKTWVRQAEKIFNTRGRDEESEIKIPYNSTYETVTILSARTIKAGRNHRSGQAERGARRNRERGCRGADVHRRAGKVVLNARRRYRLPSSTTNTPSTKRNRRFPDSSGASGTFSPDSTR